MNREEAAVEIRRLLGDAAPLLSTDDITAAIDAAATDGTIDGWAAAAEAAEVLGIRALGTSGITEWTSEGTSVKRTAADFFGMRDALLSKSDRADTGMTVISVDTGDHDMYPGHAAGGGYWTWDGDIPRWFPWRS